MLIPRNFPINIAREFPGVVLSHLPWRLGLESTSEASRLEIYGADAPKRFVYDRSCLQLCSADGP